MGLPASLAEPVRDADELARAFVARLRTVVGAAGETVALHEPSFEADEWALVKRCLDTGWVSSAGEYVDRFEAELAARCGTPHCVAVVNGTAALHVALLVAGVEPGDEVIVPALTFVATANAVRHCGAIPHFADSAFDTLGLDARALKVYLGRIAETRGGATYNAETDRRIAAIVPMHAFGHPVEMDPLLEVAKEFGIAVVEDAAEALGSSYKGRPCGSIGRLGSLSFNGNKIVTTGGGGAILTNDSGLAKRAKHLTTTARVPSEWTYTHDEVGYNYRLPNLNAALGCAQLGSLDVFLSRKRRLAQRYQDAFSDFEGISVFAEKRLGESNYWLNAVLLDAPFADCRDMLLAAANRAGLMCRPVWTLMHRLPMYADAPRAPLPVAEDIEARLINVPSSAKLGA